MNLSEFKIEAIRNFLLSFNNREIALGIWMMIIFIFCIANKDLRTSLFVVFKAAFNRHFVVLYLLIISYIVVIVWILNRLGIWEIRVLKETIIWLIFSSMASVFEAVKKGSEDGYFKRIIKDNIAIVVIIAFISSLYSFSLLKELLLIFVSALLGILIAIFEVQEGVIEKKIKRFLEIIVMFIAMYAIYHSGYTLYKSLDNFDYILNMKSFLVPLILSTAFVPFLIICSVYTAYELLFIRINQKHIIDKKIHWYLKLRIVLLCKLSSKKVKDFNTNSNIFHMYIKNKEDVKKLIVEYKM